MLDAPVGSAEPKVRIRVDVAEGFWRDYLPALVAVCRKYGGPRWWLQPGGILARAFQDDDANWKPECIVFKDEDALFDLSLGGHEAGHVKGLIHTKAWTTMHQWGLFRRSDPERLRDAWRGALRELEAQRKRARMEGSPGY